MPNFHRSIAINADEFSRMNEEWIQTWKWANVIDAIFRRSMLYGSEAMVLWIGRRHTVFLRMINLLYFLWIDQGVLVSRARWPGVLQIMCAWVVPVGQSGEIAHSKSLHSWKVVRRTHNSLAVREVRVQLFCNTEGDVDLFSCSKVVINEKRFWSCWSGCCIRTLTYVGQWISAALRSRRAMIGTERCRRYAIAEESRRFAASSVSKISKVILALTSSRQRRMNSYFIYLLNVETKHAVYHTSERERARQSLFNSSKCHIKPYLTDRFFTACPSRRIVSDLMNSHSTLCWRLCACSSLSLTLTRSYQPANKSMKITIKLCIINEPLQPRCLAWAESMIYAHSHDYYITLLFILFSSPRALAGCSVL